MMDGRLYRHCWEVLYVDTSVGNITDREACYKSTVRDQERREPAGTRIWIKEMPRTFEEILVGLASFEAEDFDYNTPGCDGLERLSALTDELLEMPNPERFVPALFDVMERMPEADLGSPGAVVHTLEKMHGYYEEELAESVKRIPTPLTLWMVNRIINAAHSLGQREFWIGIIKFAVDHPKAPEVARLEAQHFIRYQSR